MTSFHIPDMSCCHCKANVEAAVKGLDTGAALQFDMEARKVEIATKALPAAIIAALASAGYPATVV